MKNLLFLLGAALPLALAAAPPPAGPTFTGCKRTYSDGSEWSLATSAGAGQLKRLYADGSEWRCTIPGHSYVIKRTYAGNTEWSISEAGHVVRFKTTYGSDVNEWDFGQWNFKTAFKNDFKQFGAYGFELRSAYSDFSTWTIDDKGRVPDPALKCGMVFVAVLVAGK